jgi:hypothetical protein
MKEVFYLRGYNLIFSILYKKKRIRCCSNFVHSISIIVSCFVVSTRFKIRLNNIQTWIFSNIKQVMLIDTTRLTSIEFDLTVNSQPIPRYWTLRNQFHPGNPSDSTVTQFQEWDEIMSYSFRVRSDLIPRLPYKFRVPKQ